MKPICSTYAVGGVPLTVTETTDRREKAFVTDEATADRPYYRVTLDEVRIKRADTARDGLVGMAAWLRIIVEEIDQFLEEKP